MKSDLMFDKEGDVYPRHPSDGECIPFDFKTTVIQDYTYVSLFATLKAKRMAIPREFLE